MGTIMLAGVANAGLFASTTDRLRPLTDVSIGSVWVIPGLMLIGALVALAVEDAGRAAVSVVVAAVIGATLYGLAIAAPGLRVAGLRVKLIDDGTTFGLVALLMCGLFGMAGLGVVWITRALLGQADL
jgi:hypothetical protein